MSGPRMPWKQHQIGYRLVVEAIREPIDVTPARWYYPDERQDDMRGPWEIRFNNGLVFLRDDAVPESDFPRSYGTLDEAKVAAEAWLHNHAKNEVERWTKVRELLKSAGVGE